MAGVNESGEFDKFESEVEGVLTTLREGCRKRWGALLGSLSLDEDEFRRYETRLQEIVGEIPKRGMERLRKICAGAGSLNEKQVKAQRYKGLLEQKLEEVQTVDIEELLALEEGDSATADVVVERLEKFVSEILEEMKEKTSVVERRSEEFKEVVREQRAVAKPSRRVVYYEQEDPILGFEERPKSIEFARMDYDLVHKEIMSIKGCRANIFVGTIGILGAVGVAVLGIVGTSKETSWHNWLHWAALIPIGLLTSAIFATIHKARKLNMRRSYMETLAEYLSEGSVPKCFCGWAKAKFIVDRCRIYRARTEPVDHRLRCPLNPEDESCATVAKRSAKQITRGIGFMPDLLHSFTSVSTYVYGVAYLVAIGALLLAIMATIKEHIPNFSRTTYVTYVGVCGGVITAIFAIIIIVGRLLSARRRPEMKQEGSGGEKGEESVAEERTEETGIERFLTKGLLKYLGYFACMVVTALFLILLYAQTKGELGLIVVVAYCLGGGIAAIAVFGAYSFYDKVTSLRKGRYSAERWRHVWKECFKRCPLMEPEID